MPTRKEIDLSKRCVSDLVGPELLVSTRTHTLASRSCSKMCYQRVLRSVSSVFFFTGRQSLLQIHTHRDHRHHCHDPEHRSGSCVCQEVCLRWQVSVFFHKHQFVPFLFRCVGHRDLTSFWMFPADSWFTGTRCCSSTLRTMLPTWWMNRWRPTTLITGRLSFMTTQTRYSGYLLPHPFPFHLKRSSVRPTTLSSVSFDPENHNNLDSLHCCLAAIEEQVVSTPWFPPCLDFGDSVFTCPNDAAFPVLSWSGLLSRMTPDLAQCHWFPVQNNSINDPINNH